MKYNARACKFNMDTGCVELLLRDGRMISIDCTGVEDALDVTMAQTVQGVQTCPFCKMVRCISRTFTGRDAVPNQLVQLLKLQTLCPEPDSQHPTTNMEPLGRWYSPMRRSRIRE